MLSEAEHAALMQSATGNATFMLNIGGQLVYNPDLQLLLFGEPYWECWVVFGFVALAVVVWMGTLVAKDKF